MMKNVFTVVDTLIMIVLPVHVIGFTDMSVMLGKCTKACKAYSLLEYFYFLFHTALNKYLEINVSLILIKLVSTKAKMQFSVVHIFFSLK